MNGKKALNLASDYGQKGIVEFLMKNEIKKQQQYFDINQFFDLFNILSRLITSEISGFLLMIYSKVVFIDFLT